MTATPAPGNEPNRPAADGTLAPTTPGQPPTKTPLTRTQKTLIGVVATAVLIIATLGFIGSYAAVTHLATEKGFGGFAKAFPIGIDAGIIAFLALDLLLTWLRIGFPLLRYTAWGLTAATISFNAVAAWPDPVGVSMHGTIPVLFVIAVEAARHAIGRIADIVADKHIDGVPLSRWIVAPLGSFRIWRRMRLWNIRSYETVLQLEQERRIYVAQLRGQHGRWWRKNATAAQLLVLRLARDGMSIQEAVDRPEREARKLAEAAAKREAEARTQAEAEAEVKHQAELRKAEAEAKRRAEIAEAEAAEAEARARTEAAAEAARLEVEAKRRSEAEAARVLVAETEAKLAEIARARKDAEAEAELNRQRRHAEQARLQDEAARQARQREATERAQRIAAKAATASTSTSGTASTSATKPAGTSGSASTPISAITGTRAKKQAEVEAILARMVEANDPKAMSLTEVMDHFGLTQTTAYDRLKTAQKLWAETQAA